MPIGDVRSDLVSVAADGYLDIRPPPTEEWVIINIFHEYDVDLAWVDSTRELVFDTDVGRGLYAAFTFHVRNGLWLRVKNKDTANARLVGYSGVVTKG